MNPDLFHPRVHTGDGSTTESKSILPPAVDPAERVVARESDVNATPVVDPNLAVTLALLLQSLLKAGERMTGPVKNASPTSARIRSYTPRSKGPLTRLAIAPSTPTLEERRKIRFSCPCCRRETTVIRRQAGRRIRCPHCHGAVQAPNPTRHQSAYNLQRDVESLLRPASFAPPIRSNLPRWTRKFIEEPLLILAFATLVPFTILMMQQLQIVLDGRGSLPNNATDAAPSPDSPSPSDGASERAVALVRRYLEATTPDAKAACVRDPQRVAPLLSEMSRRHPEAMRAVTDVDLKAAGLGHYSDPKVSLPVTPVVAVFGDGARQTFFVEHSVKGDAIEWESSVAYSEPLPRRTGTTERVGRAQWRVEAQPDDYFNRSFSDANGLLCLKLSRPDAPDETFWAYAPKDSEVGRSLLRIWNEVPNELTRRLTVAVDFDRASAKTRQLRLAGLVHAGWRTPDQPAPLVAGNP